MQVPHIRLHDCEWPGADIVDIHAIFPVETVDPNEPSHYRFAKTDAYLKATVATGARVIYRLGESIETTAVKHHVHPPLSTERWADTCLGIIRHYNYGWSHGPRHGIDYWEIWNEPENRPAMWSGSDADYFRLYATTATRIKATFPHLKVGGPSVGAVGEMVAGKFQPSEFTIAFLSFCSEQRLPLDFFSWHTYTNDPALYSAKANGIRRLLNSFGFQTTEIHLNEWNYLPDNDWAPIIGTAQQGEQRKQFYQRQGGAEGAAFIISVLLSLQDSPVDVGNYYAGDTNQFGLFDRFGTPKATFYAFKAFAEMLSTPVRLPVHSQTSDPITIGAGIDDNKTKINVLAASANGFQHGLRLQLKSLPWSSSTRYETYLVSDEKNLAKIQEGEVIDDYVVIEDQLKSPSVILIKLWSMDGR